MKKNNSRYKGTFKIARDYLIHHMATSLKIQTKWDVFLKKIWIRKID